MWLNGNVWVLWNDIFRCFGEIKAASLSWVQSGRRWIGAHFGRSCGSVHGSCWVCPGSGSGQLRLPDYGFQEAGIHVTRTKNGIIEPQGATAEALTLSWGARFITWCLRCPFVGNYDGAPGIFGVAGRIWATALDSDPPKKPLCYISPVSWTYGKYRVSVLSQSLIAARRDQSVTGDPASGWVTCWS